MKNKTLQVMLKEYFDYQDGKLIWKQGNSRVKVGRTAGSISGKGYINIKFKQKTYLAHRLIYLYHHGYLPEVLDHINGFKTDNRIENLREATASQNQHNRVLNANNTSGYKGVTFNKLRNKWQAKVKTNNVYKHLGLFEDIEDAAMAVSKYRLEVHGEFAKHA
jgi:hypothetical protein